MLLLAWLFIATPFLLLQHPPAFRIRAELIKVPVTVLDPQGRIVSHLRQEDFGLLNESEPRSIENFVLDRTPIQAVLLLDVSSSIREEIEEIRSAAVDFARSLQGEDRVAVTAFADEIVLLQDWTNDLRRLGKSLKRLQRGYRTALYDALLTTAREHVRSRSGKRVIILFTDGLDNESQTSCDQVTQNLIENNIALYIVSRTRLVQPEIAKSRRVEFLNRVMKNLLHGNHDYVEAYFREKERAMNQLAETTGGRVFFPERLHDLRETYLELAHELKSQYILTFRPPSRSHKTLRNIQVLCTTPGSEVSHRKQYTWRC